MTLTDAELERYARHIVLPQIGGVGQTRLREAQVVVIGAGGIGCPVIAYLAAAGVGTIRIVDPDVVSLSNLQRQILFADSDIGQPKAEVAAQAAQRINPHVKPIAINRAIDVDNAALLLRDADVVIDGCDNFATRLIVAEAATRNHIPLVSAAVGSFEGQIATYRGWEADQPCYGCLVGDDPERPDVNCADTGVVGALTGVIGSMAALEVIRAIHPFGADTAGKLVIADLLSLRFRTLTVAKDPACPVCAQVVCPA